MEASIELKNLYLRLLTAYEIGDEAFMEQHTAPDALIIGTDPNEWWDTREAFMDAFRGELKAFRDMGATITPGNPEAYVDGRIGWIADRPQYALPDGSVLETRITAIVRWYNGEWRFVQQHISLGIANPDANETPASGEQELALEATA